MMKHSVILAGADIASNVKSELIDYADLKGLTLLYDNIFFDMVPKSAQLLESVPELLLRVHHDRAVPGDGLLERLSRHGASARFHMTNVG